MIVLVLMLSLASCATNPVSGRPDFMLVSEADEIKMGGQTDVQVTKEYGLYSDPRLSAYINAMGQRMGKQSHRPQLDWHFKVLDASVVNAFAAPGGYIYFTRGILGALNSEAELAGVMGHEIGHVTARHSAQQVSRAQVAQIGLIVPELLGLPLVSGLAQIGMGLFFLSYSRDNEREADALSVEYALKAGYDAAQMAEFFETLKRMDPKSDRSGLPAWFSTHPSPADREKSVRDQAQQWKRKLGVTSPKVSREEYLAMVDGIIYGEDPRQGYADKGFYIHPTMRFQFPVPEGWKLNDTPSVVQMLSPNKDAAILFSGSAGNSPADAAQKFLTRSKARVLKNESIRVNGFPAQRAVSDVTTRQGSVRALSCFIQKGDKIYSFQGLTKAASYPQYEKIFDATMGQFRELTDAAKINVMPDRLRIRTAQKADTLGNALRSLGVPEGNIKGMATLNGGTPEERIPTGRVLKVVEKGRR